MTTKRVRNGGPGVREAVRQRAKAAGRNVTKIDKAWNQVVRARTPAEWRAMIDAIPDSEVRIKAAFIVWWDHFGQRPASNRWTELDDLLEIWRARNPAGVVAEPVDRRKLKRALQSLGYPEWFAEGRAQ
jgi:hypothetical protein